MALLTSDRLIVQEPFTAYKEHSATLWLKKGLLLTSTVKVNSSESISYSNRSLDAHIDRRFE